MEPLPRRSILALAASIGAVASAKAAGFGNPDNPAQGAINANPQSLTDPGPKNPAISQQFPSFSSPPPTDVGGGPLLWASFNNAPKRIQDGGWARELTQEDFAISDTISGVNMRLDAGGIRELHWHQQAEWAVMLTGKCRVTTIDAKGRASVDDVSAGDLWYFPPGLPHSLQGLGPDGAEFVLAFDNGHSSEFNTLLLTDWIAHTPPAVLAQNFNVDASVFKNIPINNLWIFQGQEPGSLAADRQAAKVAGDAEAVIFHLSAMAPNKKDAGGQIQIQDSTNFPISKNIAAALVTLRPGGLREMHWHPNADEWQYWIKGKGRMTTFNAGLQVHTTDFNPGDVGYVKKSLGHFIQNVGNDELQFLEIFRTDKYEEVSLADWLSHVPPQLVKQHLRIDPTQIARFPSNSPGVISA